MYCHRVGKESINLTAIKSKKTINLFGPPPKCKEGSLTDPKGYWVMIKKEATGFKNLSKLQIKAVYNYCTQQR